MSKAQLIIYLIFILFMILGISSFMEIYKKIIRKDKAKIWENRLIGFIMSAAATFALKFLGIMQPALQLLGAKEWADWIFYVIVIFYVQKETNMKIVKKLINTCLNILLKRNILKEDENENTKSTT